MPGAAVKVGPFTGGMNTYSDPTAIGDNEALEITNFDIDIDGSLVTRYPFVKEANTPGGISIKLLGLFTWTDGSIYLIGSANDGSPGAAVGTYYYNFATNLWITINAFFPATAMVQYQNKAWLVADVSSPQNGGSWDPTAGFVAVAAMPRGVAAVVYKERMFIGQGGNDANSSRLFFSVPATFTSWNASDFLDVKTGDGQSIVDLAIYSDTVVIFKQDSTYIYAYDSKPTAGQVRAISNTIGISGKNCFIEYENSLYLFHDRSVYQVTNWNYSKLNLKVPFEYQNSDPTNLTTPFSVSLMGDRLVVRYYEYYYVWGLKTRVWVLWKSTRKPMSKLWLMPQASTSASPNKYFCTTQFNIVGTTSTFTGVFSIEEAFAPDRSETINWELTTKTYDFESPYTFKRLFWWGVDLISKGSFLAQVFPIFYGHRITWNEAALRTWDQAAAFTWDRGATPVVNIDTNIGVSGSSSRTFVKLLKGLRFRQLNLKISGSNDGTSTNAPTRLFTITIFADSKEKVVTQVT